MSKITEQGRAARVLAKSLERRLNESASGLPSDVVEKGRLAVNALRLMNQRAYQQSAALRAGLKDTVRAFVEAGNV